jgi:hypothetical protein
MKRVISAVLVMVLILSFVGCSGSKPDNVVKTFCDAIKAFDLEAAAACTESGSDEISGLYDDTETEDAAEQIMTYVKECASKMTYTLGESKVDNDNATVVVSFTYVDAAPVITSAMGEYITQAFALAFSDVDESEIENLFSTVFAEKVETVETSTATADVTFNCVKVDGDWKIASFSDEDEETITNVITSNISSALDGLGDAFETDDETDTENITWQDASLGQEMELATLKICVNGCEEKSELTADYYEPEQAQDGTKFVVFTAVVENITTDTVNFNNEIRLTDSQGRNYDPYFNALWYYDETFSYTDLAPNIPQSGYFVYNIPEDSTGYYLSVTEENANIGYRVYAE